MYPLGCLSGLALIKMTVTDALNSTQMSQISYFNQWGTRSVELNFTAGRTYQVNVNINWPMLLKIGQTPNWEFNLEIIGPGTAKITE